MKRRWTAVIILLTVLYFLAAVAITYRLAEAYIAEEQSTERELVRQRIAIAKSTLEAELYQDIYLADSLATVVNLDPDFAVNNWQSIAAKLLNKSEHVRNVGMAPDNVIQFIYPLEGNEQALGVDFRTLPEQLRTVEQARITQELFLAGPLDLIQGGKGVIARYPVFSDYPESTQYWGTVSVVINYNSVARQAGLLTMEDAEIALRGVDGKGLDGDIFYGQASTFQNADIEIPINVPGGEWRLAMNYQISLSESARQTVSLIWLIGLVGAAFLYVTMFVTYRSFRLARQASLQDELTQLPNRRFMMSYLASVFAARTRQPFTLVNIDLNRFKQVNDNYGHEAGDALLRHVATQLKQHIRVGDVLARIGGDEFLLVLSRLHNSTKVEHVLDAMNQRLADHPMHWGEAVIVPSLSMGYAISGPQHQSIEALLADADAAMYSAKRAAHSQSDR